MSRRTIRVAVAGGALATVALCGGTAFAANSYPVQGGGGGGNTPGGTGTGGTGGTGTTGGNTGGSQFTSNGGTVTGGGGASTTSGGGSLPFTGFELVTALTLGVGAIGAGSVVVVASRRRRGTSAVA